jgi:2-phosphosulfolactate phosphatase
MSPEQSRYQIRFDWGRAGAHAIGGDADVIVWVDAIGSSLDLDELPQNPAVIEATFATAAAAADWVARLQKRLARRVSIAIVAAGALRSDGDIRFAVEDQLAAGAVIDRLARAGLDATSPEAAAAEGAFLHLQRAVGHLLTASVTATGAGESLGPASFRVDESLGHEAVVVRRELD